MKKSFNESFSYRPVKSNELYVCIGRVYSIKHRVVSSVMRGGGGGGRSASLCNCAVIDLLNTKDNKLLTLYITV